MKSICEFMIDEGYLFLLCNGSGILGSCIYSIVCAIFVGKSVTGFFWDFMAHKRLVVLCDWSDHDMA